MEVGLGSGDFVLDGDPTPFPKKGAEPPPIFGHFYCGQTAECIKMPLGTEVGLGAGDIVLDGGPAPPKGVWPPILAPCLLWPNCRPSQLLLSSCSIRLCDLSTPSKTKNNVILWTLSTCPSARLPSQMFELKAMCGGPEKISSS